MILEQIPQWVSDIMVACGRIRCEHMSIVLTDEEVEEIGKSWVSNHFAYNRNSGFYGTVSVPSGYRLIGIYDGVSLLQKHTSNSMAGKLDC